MNNLLLSLLIVAVFAIVWIEWVPQRYAVVSKLLLSFVVISIGIGWLPEWYGWVVLLIGIAEVAWIYFSPKRRKEWPNLFSAPIEVLREVVIAIRKRERKSERPVEPTEPAKPEAEKTSFMTAERARNTAAAVATVALSPIAAIPWVIVLSVILVASDMFLGNAPQLANDLPEAARQVLGRSYVALVATADLFFRYLWLSGPLLLAGAYAIVVYSKSYIRGLLLFGIIYPLVFVAADIFDWFDGPFFN